MNLSIIDLKRAYNNSENIIELLSKNEPHLTRSQIIEIAYDIQSGSYTKYALNNQSCLEQYVNDIKSLAAKYLRSGDKILDCGTGEITTLSRLSHCLPTN